MDNVDDLTLLHQFHQCGHHIRNTSKCHGQNRLLIQLQEKGTLTQRELGDITGLRSATLSEQLENMEKAGYVIRTRNRQDRRNIDVSLTASGQDAAEKARQNRARRAKTLFSILNQEEKAQLHLLLNRLLSYWEESASKQEEAQ